MSWRDTYYSRMIAWLRIILPLAALGILSTLFLLSRNVDPTQTIPFSQIDLEERARDQQVTAPSFSGATLRGDLIAFTAATARPDPQNASRLEAAELSARINLRGGTEITFSALQGIVDDTADEAQLIGGVVVTSSTGYRIITESLTSGMRELRAETDGKVEAEGPPGQFSAGKMQLTTEGDSGHAQLLFTNGVRLLYDPGK